MPYIRVIGINLLSSYAAQPKILGSIILGVVSGDGFHPNAHNVLSLASFSLIRRNEWVNSSFRRDAIVLVTTVYRLHLGILS